LAATPALSDVQNTQTGPLQIETKSALPRLINLDNLRGQLESGAELPNLAKLNLQNGATLKALGTADFSGLTDLTVQSGSEFLADENTKFSRLRNLSNFGTATFNTQLTALSKIHNGQDATLHLLDKVVVSGDVVNDGKMLIRHKRRADDGTEYKDLRGRIYRASGSAVLRFENRARASFFDWINDGLLYSPTGFKLTQHSTVTKWGRTVAEDGIEYEIDGAPLTLSGDLIQSVINGPNKTLKINSKTNINVTKPVSMNVKLDVEAPVIDVRDKLKVKEFKAKTKRFTLNRTGYLGAQEHILITADAFENVSGKMHALGDITLNVGTFVNTGGQQTFPKVVSYSYYTKTPARLGQNLPASHGTHWYPDYPAVDSNGKFTRMRLVSHNATERILGYFLDISNAGQIACNGTLSITANSLQNNFGFLNGQRLIQIISDDLVSNQVGLIYSQGDINVRGQSFENGKLFVHSKYIADAVDPDDPIKRQEQLLTRANEYRQSHTFHRANWHFDGWADYRYFDVIWDYRPFNEGLVPLPQSECPGYIFSDGKVRIDADFDVNLGQIVARRDIYVRGRSALNTANLVAGGNVEAAFQRIEIDKMRILAQNILLDRFERLIVGGFVTPVASSYGGMGLVVNLQKTAKALGFAVSHRGIDLESQTNPSYVSPTVLTPYSMADDVTTIRATREVGHINRRPDARFFVPTVSDQLLAKLLKLVVTPIYGVTDEFLDVRIIGQLEAAGRELTQSFSYSKGVRIP
jgi:hypothetical protein